MKIYTLLLPVLLLVIPAFASEKEPPPYNILWLTGESMQAKHLGCYGYDKPTSPNIDAFAKTGTLFEQCVSPSGWTSESIVSNLTGVYSTVHGVITRDRHIPAQWYTPMEMLRDRGYTIPRLSPYQGKTGQQYMGYTQDEVEQVEIWDWIKKHKNERFFIWYHIWESHLPYDPPEKYKKHFWQDDFIKSRDNKWRLDLVRTMNVIPRSSVVFDPEQDAEGVRALYDGSLRVADEKFGKIIKALEEAGLRDNTIIVFSADHGEGLLEHGLIGHASTLRGGTLYDEIIHVPMIISLPERIPQGKRISSLVGGLDAMPTVFELLGIERPDYFQGKSMMPLIEEKEEPDRDPIRFAASSYKGYQEDDPKNVPNLLRVARTDEWKLIYQIINGKESYELYNLKNDPGETRDAKRGHPYIYRKLKHQLHDWMRQCETHEVALESQ